MGRNIIFHLKSKYPHYLYFAISLLIFYPIFWGKSFFFRDFFNFHYPLWSFVENSIKNGIIPLWNPFMTGGQTSGGNSNYLIFYPISILIKLLPFNSLFNMNFFLFLHHYFGTLFFYYLLLKLNFSKKLSFTGGLIYSLSGVVLSTFFMLNYVPYLVIFPLSGILLINLLKLQSFKNISLISILFGISLTVFEPLFFMSLFIFLLSIFLVSQKDLNYKKSLVSIIITLIFSTLIASPFLNEAYSLYKNSYRGKAENSISNKLYDTHPLFLENLFVSNLFNIDFKVEKKSKYWGGKLLNKRLPFFLSIFIGFIPLYFAIYTLFLKRKKFYYLWFFLLISIILSLGHYIKSIPEIFIHIPLLSKARYFSKFLISSEFLLILLSIYGIKEFYERKGKSLLYPFLILIPILVISFKSEYGFYLTLIFVTVLTVLLFFKEKSRKIIPFLIFLELFLGNSSLLKFTPVKKLALKSEVLKFLEKNYPKKSNYYIAFNPYTYSLSPKNGNSLLDEYLVSQKCGIAFYGITYGFHYLYNATLDEMESTYSANLYKFLKKINGLERETLFKKTGVKFFITPGKYKLKGYKLLKTFDVGANYRINLYEIEGASDRFKISHSYKFLSVNEYNLYEILTPFDIVECRKRFKFVKPIGYEKSEYAKILKETPNCVKLEVNLKKDGFLIFNTTYSPKWKVKVNNTLVSKCRVNYGFQGVFLKKGKYRVLFYYDHKMTDYLLLLSIILTLILIFYNLFNFSPLKFKKERNSPKE